MPGGTSFPKRPPRRLRAREAAPRRRAYAGLPMTVPGKGRIHWESERDRIDLVTVAAGLLGPPPGRRGERGFWWSCPFHVDRNPSFRVYRDREGRWRWQCFGCCEKG